MFQMPLSLENKLSYVQYNVNHPPTYAYLVLDCKS